MRMAITIYSITVSGLELLDANGQPVAVTSYTGAGHPTTRCGSGGWLIGDSVWQQPSPCAA